MPPMRTVSWVFLGGCVGTALRASVDLALADDVSRSWLATLAVNVVGALLLGLVMARLRRRPRAPDWSHSLLGIGLLGSFTTYSTLAVDAVRLGRETQAWLLLGYPMVSLLLGSVATIVGLRLATPRPRPPLEASC
jgi:fluoride exporter